MEPLCQQLRGEADKATCYASTRGEYPPNQYAHTMRNAANLIEQQERRVADIQNVIKGAIGWARQEANRITADYRLAANNWESSLTEPAAGQDRPDAEIGALGNQSHEVGSAPSAATAPAPARGKKADDEEREPDDFNYDAGPNGDYTGYP